MKIYEMAVEKLIEYDQNPRKNDPAVKFVANSIKNFGFKVPIVIDVNNVIVCGHTRLKAARKLKMKTVPCLIADDLTEDQVKAFRLADNKTNEFAEWDINLLNLELADIEMDMTELGFAELGIEPKEVDEDEVPEPDEEVQSKLGDIYQCGSHRVMCGDSTKGGDVEKLMAGEKARILFTSPPYSDMRTYRGGKNLDTVHLSDFIKTYRPYCEFQIVNLGLQVKDEEILQYWDDYIAAARECGYKLIAWNVWDKGSAGSIGAQKQAFSLSHEWLFVFGDVKPELNKTVPKKAASIQGRHQTRPHRMADGSIRATSAGDTSGRFKRMDSVTRIVPERNNSAEWRNHPARFPVKLPSEYIQAMTDEGDGVIDCFGGSGTTLIAAEQLGRKSYLMELDPVYCDMIIKRWEKFTGEKAVKIKG